MRQGLQARSFEQAAVAFTDATGCSMSRESMRKVTQQWGEAVDQRRNEQAEKVLEGVSAGDAMNMVADVDPITTQASISTDGGMVLVRDEGWKEVKMVTISAVRPKTPSEKKKGRAYKADEPNLMLERHTYQAGLWEANEMAPHQYLEGLRRHIPHCDTVSSANDGAKWIKRITEENYPQATQIIDWYHAAEKMWDIGKQTIVSKQQREAWVEARLDDLWEGDLPAVNEALANVDVNQAMEPKEIEQSVGYFHRQRKRMQYGDYRKAGYPIGSGAVESGINTVVHHRLKRQGRGWSRDNVNPMLAALSELHSDKFEQAWANTQ